MGAAGGLELLAESRTEPTIVDGASDLQEQVGSSPGPARLLRLVRPAIDQEIRRTFGHRRADPQPCAVALRVIGQPGKLAPEIFVDLVQRVPQFAGSHAIVSDDHARP